MSSSLVAKRCAIRRCKSHWCEQRASESDGQSRRSRAPKHTASTSFRFMDLPFNVRERILQLCLGEGAIEFCPEPFRFEPGTNFNLLNDKWRECGLWRDAERHHRTKHHYGIPQYAGLLRVCKQVSGEALDILYGHNEFRFSNITSVLALEYFLYHIGPKNIPRLRHLTILHPGFVVLPSSISNASTWWMGMPYWPQIRADDKKHPGFGHGKWWFAELDHKSSTGPGWWMTEAPFRVLNRIENLHHLRLLIPNGSNWTWLAAPVDLSRFTKLAVTFARLTAHDDPVEPRERVAALIAEYNEAQGTSWLAEDLSMDHLGEYATEMHQRYKPRA